MPVSVQAIGTAVPEAVLAQAEVRDLMAGHPALPGRQRRLLQVAFDASGIDTRHTVLDELRGDPQEGEVFLHRRSGAVLAPGTGVRNELYRQWAPGLLVTAASAALTSADLDAAEVTHLVTVSCTGFFAPGPDHILIARLGLDPSVERYHLGFMGCHGAFSALRAARAFCAGSPGAVVLVACVELCTLHLQPPQDADRILAASLFADGAAAAVVSARPPRRGAPVLDLDALSTVLTSAGEADMTWTIGDTGFSMGLSTYVPRLLGQNIEKIVAPLFDSDSALAGGPFAAVPLWAVHPGGRSILDKVQAALQLGDTQLQESREVLRRYGNMSSPTVLFVLQEMLRRPVAGPERVCAMAFGPGLTVETALLTRRIA